MTIAKRRRLGIGVLVAISGRGSYTIIQSQRFWLYRERCCLGKNGMFQGSGRLPIFRQGGAAEAMQSGERDGDFKKA
jgi:hypothetical protein